MPEKIELHSQASSLHRTYKRRSYALASMRRMQKALEGFHIKLVPTFKLDKFTDDQHYIEARFGPNHIADARIIIFLAHSGAYIEQEHNLC